MWHILIVVTLGSNTWQWKWMDSYASVEECRQAFVEEISPQIKPKSGASVQAICSQDLPPLDRDGGGES
jgi:hypothetical protein